MQASDLHEDPVPGLCVILKDFHDHLTSLNNHGGIPVERFACVYPFKRCGIPRQGLFVRSNVAGWDRRGHSVTVIPNMHSLDSIHKILRISHFSASIIKVRVVSHSYHPSFLAQSWETPTSD